MGSNVTKLLSESIEAGLDTFGIGVKESLYFFAKEKSIPRDEVAERIDEFLQVLQSLIGSGTRIFERITIKIFAQKAGISSEQLNGKGLLDVVHLVELRALRKSQKKRGDVN